MRKSKKKIIDESFEDSTKLMINTIGFIEFVVETYSDMLIRIAYQNLGTMLEAEDIVQEVFIKLIREKSFSDEKHLKNWLIKVTINLCRDRKRNSWYKKRVELKDNLKNVSNDINDMEFIEDIKKLSMDYRNVIYLYYYEGYKINEISEILGKSENTISSQLRRARNKLKNIILEGGY